MFQFFDNRIVPMIGGDCMQTEQFKQLLASALVLATKLNNDGSRCQLVQDFLANNGIHAGYNSIALMLMSSNIDLTADETSRLMSDVVGDNVPEWEDQ